MERNQNENSYKERIPLTSGDLRRMAMLALARSIGAPEFEEEIAGEASIGHPELKGHPHPSALEKLDAEYPGSKELIEKTTKEIIGIVNSHYNGYGTPVKRRNRSVLGRFRRT